MLRDYLLIELAICNWHGRCGSTRAAMRRLVGGDGVRDEFGVNPRATRKIYNHSHESCPLIPLILKNTLLTVESRRKRKLNEDLSAISRCEN
jgi:hypothetical protein